jgi:hypothetical protein
MSDQEREAFEAWASTYCNPNRWTEGMWLAWQARATQAEPATAGPNVWPVPDVTAKLKQIEALSAGWDEHGSTGPREPLSWESVARCAMDIARFTLAELAAADWTGATAGPVPSEQALTALRAAQRFIRNGVALGYIRMPDADTPDSAHQTPKLIDAAIEALAARQAPAPAEVNIDALRYRRLIAASEREFPLLAVSNDPENDDVKTYGRAQIDALIDSLDLVEPALAAPQAAQPPKALDSPRLQELFSATIDGALTSGYQGVAPAPAGHWLEPWWRKGRAVAEQQAAQPPQEPAAKWGDPRVQTVYELLCENEAPPDGQHWEGWLARRIVDALAAQPVAPAARSEGEQR